MSGTASYFRDEAGVHLTLHLTPDEYDTVIASLGIYGTPLGESMYDLLARARTHEETKAERAAGIMGRMDYTEDSHGAVVDGEPARPQDRE